MNGKKHFLKTGDAGFLPGVLLLPALTGCAGDADAQHRKV
jgi:hypothetical protein